MGELVVRGRLPGRVLLGRLRAHGRAARVLELIRRDGASPPLAAPESYGVLVVGPSRSGKTSSVLMPAARDWDGPVITTSIRDDVLRDSWEARKAAGWPVLIYNPKNLGGYGSNTWSPLTAAMGDQPWLAARRTALALIHAAGFSEDGANNNAAFWNAAAADFLGPLLLAAAQDGPSMEPVLRWLQEGEDGGHEVLERLEQYPEAQRIAAGVWDLAEKLRDSIYLTARTALAAYQDTDVLKTCLAQPGESVTDITPESVLGGEGTRGATLYIISPPTELRYFAPLFSALITSMIDATYTRANRGDVGERSVLVALDEAANIAPIEELPSISSTAAGAGIQLVTVLQDLGQAEGIWGREGARTLLQNHYARLILGGTVDQPTLEWLQAILGEREVETQSHSGNGILGRRTTTRSKERVPVLSMAEIREMKRGDALLIAGSYPAARVRLRMGTTI
jgi:type IV secretion system protein VirD4